MEAPQQREQSGESALAPIRVRQRTALFSDSDAPMPAPFSEQDARTIESGRRNGLALTLLVCLAAMVGDALDFIPDSSGFEIARQRWESSVSYYMHPGCPSFVTSALDPAVERLTPIPHSNAGINNSIGYDRKVTVYCANEEIQALSMLPENVEADTQFSSAGSARRYWSKTTKLMLDCDIWLNSEKIDADNIDIVLGHEWGHCLGLRHENRELSIMNSFLPLIISPQPTIDDLAGLNILYDLCVDELDSKGDHFMHSVPFDGDYYYGIMPAGGVWPLDVHTVGFSECD